MTPELGLVPAPAEISSFVPAFGGGGEPRSLPSSPPSWKSRSDTLALSVIGGGPADVAFSIVVDGAVITLGNTEKNPVYLAAGKMAVPFGNYETQMISDPLTLEIGETAEDALQLGVEAGGFYGSVYAFNLGGLQLFQVVFSHGRNNAIPWTRRGRVASKVPLL